MRIYIVLNKPSVNCFRLRPRVVDYYNFVICKEDFSIQNELICREKCSIFILSNQKHSSKHYGISVNSHEKSGDIFRQIVRDFIPFLCIILLIVLLVTDVPSALKKSLISIQVATGFMLALLGIFLVAR